MLGNNLKDLRNNESYLLSLDFQVCAERFGFKLETFCFDFQERVEGCSTLQVLQIFVMHLL